MQASSAYGAGVNNYIFCKKVAQSNKCLFKPVQFLTLPLNTLETSVVNSAGQFSEV